MEAKYNYFDIVRIQTNHPDKRKFNRQEGFVIGISGPGSSREYAYAVHLDSEERGWDFSESELEATGKKHDEPFYLGELNYSAEGNPKSKYDEYMMLSPKQLLHGIFNALSDAGIQELSIFEKVIRTIGLEFEIDPKYVNLFVRDKVKRGGHGKIGLLGN